MFNTVYREQFHPQFLHSEHDFSSIFFICILFTTVIPSNTIVSEADSESGAGGVRLPLSEN